MEVRIKIARSRRFIFSASKETESLRRDTFTEPLEEVPQMRVIKSKVCGHFFIRIRQREERIVLVELSLRHNPEGPRPTMIDPTRKALATTVAGALFDEGIAA